MLVVPQWLMIMQSVSDTSVLYNIQCWLEPLSAWKAIFQNVKGNLLACLLVKKRSTVKIMSLDWKESIYLNVKNTQNLLYLANAQKNKPYFWCFNVLSFHSHLASVQLIELFLINELREISYTPDISHYDKVLWYWLCCSSTALLGHKSTTLSQQ